MGFWSEHSNHGFRTEEEYLDSLKKSDSYRFDYPFEYIATNHGNDRYDIAEAQMVVDVAWDSTQHGYVISFDVPEMHRIDPAQGNGDARSFYDYSVESRLMSDLAGLGIDSTMIVV